jgi:hypothetical protein
LHLDELGHSHLLQTSEEIVLIEVIEFLIEQLLKLLLLRTGDSLLLHYNLN